MIIATLKDYNYGQYKSLEKFQDCFTVGGGSPSLSGDLGVQWMVSHWTDYLREAAEHLLFGSLCI